MDWKHLLAYITGPVDQELLLRNEYLVTENRLLHNQSTGRRRLTEGERTTLAAIGQKLGQKAVEAVANIVKPDTILAWHRQLVAQKFDGATQRKAPGRPMIAPEVEAPAPWRPAWCHGHADAAASLMPQATRRRRGGRKGALEFLSALVSQSAPVP
jgi:hypothetical protein